MITLERLGGWLALAALVMSGMMCSAQETGKRKIIIDQDAAGPAGTDQQSILLLIQSPQTEGLGITVVTGNRGLSRKYAHDAAPLKSSHAQTFRSWRARSIRWFGASRKRNCGKDATGR